MKSIVIWESHSTLEGGQKVSLEILDVLKSEYKCIFFVPDEGRLTEEISKRGIEYKIIPIGHYSEGKKGSKDIAQLILYAPGALRSAYQALKENRTDLIYSNGSRTFIYSSILGSLMSIPVIWHVHNFFEDRKTRFILNCLGRLKHVKKIIFVSSSVSKQFPLFRDKAKVIHNALKVDEFKETEGGWNVREEQAISPSVKIISIISWISRPKKIEVFLRAIRMVLEQYRDVHFLIAGGIKDGHKPYYDELLLLTEKLRIKDHITFTGHCNKVPDLLSSVYVNCITSLETYSLVIPEAYISGVPVIGPDRGGPSELIDNGKTGMVYKFGDERDLAEKILLLLKEPGLRDSLSENCRASSKRFDHDIFREQIRDVVGQSI